MRRRAATPALTRIGVGTAVVIPLLVAAKAPAAMGSAAALDPVDAPEVGRPAHRRAAAERLQAARAELRWVARAELRRAARAELRQVGRMAAAADLRIRSFSTALSPKSTAVRCASKM